MDQSTQPLGFVNNDPFIIPLQKNLRDVPSSRLVTTQLLISILLGSSALLIFSFMRIRFPNIYMARLNYLNVSNRKFMPPMIKSKSLTHWFTVIFNIDDNDVLEYAGLDAFVFLSFFKMSIKLLSICWLFSALIISPIRYYYTGNYDQNDPDGDNGDGDDDNDGGDNGETMAYLFGQSSSSNPADFKPHLWLYVVFTYVFTVVAQHFLLQQTKKVIECRQKILGLQNSITDRTIRLSGIPPELRDEALLKAHIESLDIGKVSSIVICREWNKLNILYIQRTEIIEKLENYWSIYLGSNRKDTFSIRPFISDSFPLTRDIESRYHDNETNDNDDDDDDQETVNGSMGESQNLDSNSDYDDYSTHISGASATTASATSTTSSAAAHRKRPQVKLGFFGLHGTPVDAIDYYTQQLNVIDEEILLARQRHYPATPTAFVTMDSVATAQMVAQAVLDPRVHFLITRLAPAPSDIIWENVTLPRKDRLIKIYYITIITGILCVAFIFPVGYLATLLNLKTISKFWPDLGDFLSKNEWSQRFVTDLLPVYIFTLLNFLIPFLYVWLSSKQGYISHGEEELSVVSKNFFYVFVNLFLVFTMAGTVSNYWGYLSDSKKIATQLASSLNGLSSFYVDTIMLQGIGMMPFKLLLVGQLIKFPFFKASCRTPRHFKELYKPPVFNFGLQLPHPLLILIITLLYSVMSTKILSAGLAYFVIGYYVYKYQLIYSCIHPQHSTGKVWPIIFRRVVLGLLLFQMTVAGSLSLSNSYILAMCLIPLPFTTLLFYWNFERNYLPLSFFIALRAIKSTSSDTSAEAQSSGYASNESYNTTPDAAAGVSSSSEVRSRTNQANSLTTSTTRTIDERRELGQTYAYPYLFQSLDGPWLSVDGEQIVMATNEGTIRKKFTFEEY